MAAVRLVEMGHISQGVRVISHGIFIELNPQPWPRWQGIVRAVRQSARRLEGPAGRAPREGQIRREEEGPGPDWADLAIETGFYDQAHLANEFRSLAGLTPGEFWKRAVSGSSKTPA